MKKYLLIVGRNEKLPLDIPSRDEWTLDSYDLEEIANVLRADNYDDFTIYEVVGRTQRNERKSGITAEDLIDILKRQLES